MNIKMKFIFVIFLIPFLLYCCNSYPNSHQNNRQFIKSNNKNDMNNYNKLKEITIKVIFGNVNINISGQIISKNMNGENIKENTINKIITLQENNEFKYVMKMDEFIMLNVMSIDNNDAKILVYEHDFNAVTIYEYNKKIITKEYIINGNNNLGKIISISNVYY
jgi:hypothetical protein